MRATAKGYTVCLVKSAPVIRAFPRQGRILNRFILIADTTDMISMTLDIKSDLDLLIYKLGPRWLIICE